MAIAGTRHPEAGNSSASQSTLAKIRTGQDGLGYSQSYLHMLLDATADYSKFQVPNFKKTARGTGLPLTVKVNSIAT